MVELPEHHADLQHSARRKDDSRRSQSCEILSEQHTFTRNGREQIEMKALVQHFAADQVHEYADAPEEHGKTQEIELKDRRENKQVLIERAGIRFSYSDKAPVVEEQTEIVLPIGVSVKILFDNSIGADA